MADQYPQLDKRCGTVCAYAARVRQFAEQRGVSFDSAMTELEARLEQVRWKVMPGESQRQKSCETMDVPAEECRVLRLAQGIAACYGMTPEQYMESAYVDDFFSGAASGHSGTAVAISAAVEAAQTTATQPEENGEEKASGENQKPQALLEAAEGWKIPSLPTMTKTPGVLPWPSGLRLRSCCLSSRRRAFTAWATMASLHKKAPTMQALPQPWRSAAPYQEGYDAARRGKRNLRRRLHRPALPRSRQEGYEAGYAAGHEDGSNEGYDAGYDSGTSGAAQSAIEAEKNTRVWVSKRLGSRYHSSQDCPLVIKPQETTLQKAEDEGYTACDWCW